MKPLKTLLPCLLALIVLQTSASALTIEDARAEYSAGRYDNAFSMAQQLAANPDELAARHMMAGLKLTGRGTPKDVPGALDIWKALAAKDYERANATLGALYLAGGDIEQDLDLAKTYLEAAVRQKNPEATYNLGFMYQHELGVEFSEQKFLELYNLAAAAGYAKALLQLGSLNERNILADASMQKACDFYARAGEAGLAQGAFQAGKCFATGNGKAKDLKAAFRWYEIAALANDSMAQANLGYMYEKGYGVSADMAKAYKWYRLSADKIPSAAQRAANLTESGKLDPDLTTDQQKKQWQDELAKNIELGRQRDGILFKQ